MGRNAYASRAWKGEKMNSGHYVVASCLAGCYSYLHCLFPFLITASNSILPAASLGRRLPLDMSHETEANCIGAAKWLWPWD